MKITSINLFYPIWAAFAVYIAVAGHASCWVVLLIATVGFKIEYNFK